MRCLDSVVAVVDADDDGLVRIIVVNKIHIVSFLPLGGNTKIMVLVVVKLTTTTKMIALAQKSGKLSKWQLTKQGFTASSQFGDLRLGGESYQLGNFHFWGYGRPQVVRLTPCRVQGW